MHTLADFTFYLTLASILLCVLFDAFREFRPIAVGFAVLSLASGIAFLGVTNV